MAENRPKDNWDKTEIVARLATMLFIATVGWIILYLESAKDRETSNLNTDKQIESSTSIADDDRKLEASSMVIRLIDHLTSNEQRRIELAYTIITMLFEQNLLTESQAELIMNAASKVEVTQQTAAANIEKFPNQLRTYTFTLERIEIINDCDQFTDGKGDFYYSVWIDDQIVALVNRENYIQKGDGDNIGIERSVTVSRYVEDPDMDTKFELHGRVVDKDQATSGKDDVLPFAETIFVNKNEQTLKLTAEGVDDCAVSIIYTLEEIK